MKTDYSVPHKIYVQTLLFCNMSCRHCSYACSPHRREFMSVETFRASLRWEPQGLLNIGGGEPTCHPRFWEFMDMAIRERGTGRVWLATNGKRKQHALRLAEMVQEGKIRCALSQDQWHQPISPEVVKAFSDLRDQNSYHKAIRNIGAGGRPPIRQGRCDWGERLDCNTCGAPFVQWDGKVRQCGCSDAPVIGDVFNGYKPMFSGEDTWKCAFGRPDPNRPWKIGDEP